MGPALFGSDDPTRANGRRNHGIALVVTLAVEFDFADAAATALQLVGRPVAAEFMPGHLPLSDYPRMIPIQTPNIVGCRGSAVKSAASTLGSALRRSFECRSTCFLKAVRNPPELLRRLVNRRDCLLVRCCDSRIPPDDGENRTAW